MAKIIYFDNASATQVDSRVILAMQPFWQDIYANPSSVYSLGLEAKAAIDRSRRIVADFLAAKVEQIVFTSGGTEANNLAIFGAVSGLKKGRIITSEIEHPSVLRPIEELAKRGFEIVKIKVGRDGVIQVKDVRKYLNQNTVLVSIIYANNEIGTIQPIAEIGKTINNFNKRLPAGALRVVFHTDACQATQYLEMNVNKLNVDLLTINGSKIYAPKGIGALYVKEGKIAAQILGGEQEQGMRAGTENVAGIVGLATALKIVNQNEGLRLKKIRDFIIRQLLTIDRSELNGSRTKRLPSNVNLSFAGVEGEALVLYLDRRGICVSTGSACASRSLQPSYVVSAIKGDEVAHSSIRISLGRYNTMREAKIVVAAIKEAVSQLRKISESEK